jgi:hypothetical protein
MTMEQALIDAMRLPEGSDTVARIHEFGLAVANEDTMSRAIHDVYCGIVADHQGPNDKDRAQAKALMEALQKHATASPEG